MKLFTHQTLLCSFFYLLSHTQMVSAQTYQWSKTFSSDASVIATSVATDNAGAVYVTGNYEDSVAIEGGPKFISQGMGDFYVVKYNSSGLFEWALTFGGPLGDFSKSIAVSDDSYIYVTGKFQETANFGSLGTFTSNGFGDIFVLKLNSNGNLIWCRTAGDTLDEEGTKIAVSKNGGVFVTGHFYTPTDFDPGPGSTVLVPDSPYADGYVWKLDTSGALVWVKQLAGTNLQRGLALAVTDSGEVAVGGYFYTNIDVDPGLAVDLRTSFGVMDIYVIKLDEQGEFEWGITYGSNAISEGAYDIVFDIAGNVIVTGEHWATCDFDPGPAVFNLTTTGSGRVYVLKLDPQGNFIWAGNMGGIGSTTGAGIDLDSFGNIYTTGNNSGYVDFDPGPGVFQLPTIYYIDAFLSILTPTGNFLYAGVISSQNNDFGRDIKVTPSGEIYIVGNFSDTVDFDPGPGIVNAISTGLTDGYIVKLQSTLSGITDQNTFSFRIYPNPTHDYLQIEIPETITARKITVYDSTGKCVLVRPLYDGNLKISLETNQWPEGVYLIHITGPTVSATKKVLKVK